MNAERKQAGWGFWLQWLLASAIGLVVGGFLALPIGFGVGDAVENALGKMAGYIISGALFGALLGAGLGIMQSLALRTRLAGAGWWAPASTAAGAVGLAISLPIFVSANVAEAVSGIVAGASLGISIGIGQWLVLRRQVVQASWWVLASGVGLAISMAVGFPLGGEGRELIALSVTGVMAGALTGIPLVWLLRQAVPAAR